MSVFVSSRRLHTRCSLVTVVQPCALPIFQGCAPPPCTKRHLCLGSLTLFYGMARPSRRHRVMVLVCLRGRSEPMTIVTLGIDLGKNLNSIVGLDVEGRVVLRRRVRRATIAELDGKLPPCTVAMEACCGAHHVGRLFAASGHEDRKSTL